MVKIDLNRNIWRPLYTSFGTCLGAFAKIWAPATRWRWQIQQCCGSVTFWYRSGSADPYLEGSRSLPLTNGSGSGRPKTSGAGSATLKFSKTFEVFFVPGSAYSEKPWFGFGQNKCGSEMPDDTKRYAKIFSCYSVRDFRQRGRSSFLALVVSGVWGGGGGCSGKRLSFPLIPFQWCTWSPQTAWENPVSRKLVGRGSTGRRNAHTGAAQYDNSTVQFTY